MQNKITKIYSMKLQQHYFMRVICLLSMFFFLPNFVRAAVVFEENFDAQADWNKTNSYEGFECSPLGVGAPAGNVCPANTYPNNWSAYRSMPGVGGLNPVVSIAAPPTGGDHTNSAGKSLIIRQESVAGANWPGDGILMKYLGVEYPELYVQFWFKAQPGWQWPDPPGDDGFKFFRLERRYNMTDNWFETHLQGFRSAPSILVQPKHTSWGWRHNDGPRGWPDTGNNEDNFWGVCQDTTIWNGRSVCGSDKSTIDDPYNFDDAYRSPTAQGEMFDGSWHKMVYHIKMNNIGTNNGIWQAWIDGVQKTNATKLRWQTSGTPVGFNLIKFGGNSNSTFSATPADQWYLVDDIVISTTSIPADYIPGAVVSDTTAPSTTANPAGGTFTSAQSVTLSANEAATIYYTTNGTTPTTSSTVYSSPINIAATTTLKFFAKDTAGNSETVKTQTYTINIPVTYNISNVLTLVTNWLKTGTVSDVNADNIVNIRDLGIMMSKWQ